MDRVPINADQNNIAAPIVVRNAGAAIMQILFATGYLSILPKATKIRIVC